MGRVDVSIPTASPAPEHWMLGHREPPCPFLSLLPRLVWPSLALQAFVHNTPPCLHANILSFLSWKLPLIHLFSSPGPKRASLGVRLPGPAWERPHTQGSYGVWDFELPVSISQGTRAPLQRDVAFPRRRQSLAHHIGSLRWTFPGTPWGSHQSGARARLPGAHFHKRSAASCPHSQQGSPLRRRAGPSGSRRRRASCEAEGLSSARE